MTCPLHIVSYENRARDTVSVKLLAVSLERQSPFATLHIPARDLPEGLAAWLETRPNVVLDKSFQPKGRGWNVKTSVILHFLETLGERVTWIDADSVLQSDVARLIPADSNTFAVAEEGYPDRMLGSEIRTLGLGMEVGRTYARSINSCFVSVTPAHRELLDDWAALTLTADYRRAQDSPFGDRPPWYWGDQDLLAALVGSKKYVDIKVRLIRNGIDIAHSHDAYDLPLLRRIMTLFRGEPVIAHAMNNKSWLVGPDHDAFTSMYHQLSPYRFASKPYAPMLDEPDARWLTEDTRATAVVLRVLGRRPAAAGLPLGASGSWIILRERTKEIARAILRRRRPGDIRPLLKYWGDKLEEP